MALTVIGAGFGRTGTLSLKFALELLGVGRCYHMLEVVRNPPHVDLWNAAILGQGEWDRIFDGYGAAVDWPSMYFWRELASHYPQAKVLLTVRSTESWLTSMKATIFEAQRKPMPTDDPVRAARKRMIDKFVIDYSFGGNIDDLTHVAAVYERHNEEVRRVIPSERLLVYEVGQGWDPLCKFLGVPIPATEFPKLNSTDEFRAMLASP